MSNTNYPSEPVRLRKRTLKDGRQSLYLDIYYVGGARQYEYLRLYLLPDGTKEAREANRRTMRMAEAVRAKRLMDYQSGRLGIPTGAEQNADADFVAFFYQLAVDRGEFNSGNGGNWRSAYLHLLGYTKNRPVPMRMVTQAWVEGFREYLLTEAICRNRSSHLGEMGEPLPLSANSRQSYFAKMRAACHEAVRRHLLPSDPCDGVAGIPNEEVERPYLTLDEVKALAAVPCRYPSLRRAFLFSCLTGLRKSDIIKMRWKDVRQENGFTRIVFRQQKTKGQEYLDITPLAVQYLGERGEPDERPFEAFRYSSSTNAELRMWAARAGISKEITFHTGRHTFAVIMLELGTDIYTLQKLMGHKFIATTQIYAKLLDDAKRTAVSKIPTIEI